MKKYIIAILIVCLICFTAIGCTGNAEGFVFGTFYSTELKSNSPTADTNNIVDGWNMLDNTFSTSIADSIVSKLNNAKAGELVAIDTNFLEVWNLAVAIHKLSDAFCPWYFPLVELWGFSPNTYTGVATSVPNATAIAETLSYCTQANFVLDTVNMTISKTDSRSKLDFGAFLKGYAVDMAVDMFSGDSYMINVGGTIATSKSVNVKVTNPRANGYCASFTLDNQAVATSGDYERYYIYNDIRYSHIIGKDGYPSNISGNNAPISVTIVGESAMYCDALSTIVFILGDTATALLEELGYSALVITASTYYTIGEKDFDVSWQAL